MPKQKTANISKEIKQVFDILRKNDSVKLSDTFNDMLDNIYELNHCTHPLILPDSTKIEEIGHTYGGHGKGYKAKSIPKNSLNTPYLFIHKILNELNPNSTFVDIGCAMGRFGVTIHKHYPNLNYYGYDLYKDRFISALTKVEDDKQFYVNKYKNNVKFLHEDLTKTNIVKADYYYMYYPNNDKDVMNKIIDNVIKANKDATFIFSCMSEMEKDKRFKVIKVLEFNIHHHAKHVIFCKVKE